MRVGIIINPISGRHGRRTNVAVERREVADRVAKEIGIAAEILITQRAGHAREVAAELVRRGVDRVIAWGGDGTVNEVAGPIISSATALGIVPSGSGDGFARGLRIPRQPEAALRMALTARPQPIDVGYLGARHFLNIAGASLGALIAAKLTQQLGSYTWGIFLTSLISLIAIPMFLLACRRIHQTEAALQLGEA